MVGQMENITKMALAEMIQSHSQESKFGYVLSDEGCKNLIDTLYEFFETARSLKSAGDRFMSVGTTATSTQRMPTARIPR